jgi:hypothetical protein
MWNYCAMAKTIDEYAIDRNLQLVIEDVRALRNELQRGPDAIASAHLTQLAAGYLVVNRIVLNLAFEAWRDTSEEELKRMCTEARPLDESAARRAFESIGWHLIPLAPEIVRTASVNLIRVSDDNLHMLLRVLEYAKYLADCSEEAVHWHPVLMADRTDQIRQLRESLLAE